MKITRQVLARKLIDYLQRRITLAQLVDWAERAMMDADFEVHDLNVLREIIGRLGLADVRAFGMSWDDCVDYLSRLGYRVNVTISEAPVLA
jgi:hypothetical protein